MRACRTGASPSFTTSSLVTRGKDRISKSSDPQTTEILIPLTVHAPAVSLLVRKKYGINECIPSSWSSDRKSARVQQQSLHRTYPEPQSSPCRRCRQPVIRTGTRLCPQSDSSSHSQPSSKMHNHWTKKMILLLYFIWWSGEDQESSRGSKFKSEFLSAPRVTGDDVVHDGEALVFLSVGET